jgi:SnoaL-like domain
MTHAGTYDGPRSTLGSHRMNKEMPVALARWHQIVARGDATGLADLLADEVVFHSPVVHTPQIGKAITVRYLAAALRVFGNPSFRYVRELAGTHDAVLEFEVEIDGVHVNGVDMIRWDDAGRVVEFKVMLRPLKAVNLIHQKMAAMLQER